MPSRSRKILLTTLVLGAGVAAAGTGVFAAFTATTDNTNNSIASGTVVVSDNDGTAAMYTLPNQGPGSTTQRCIEIKYGGTLASTIKLYKATAITNGTAFNLTVERGSGLNPTANAFPSCTGFTAASTIYTGTLGAFPTTYAAGIDAKGSSWAQNDIVDYRFSVSVVDDPTPGAHSVSLSSGPHTFTWEARNN